MTQDATPFRLRAGKWSYNQLCQKIRKFYGVADAEHYFRCLTDSLRDKCQKGQCGIERFKDLKDWQAHMSLIYRYGDYKDEDAA